MRYILRSSFQLRSAGELRRTGASYFESQANNMRLGKSKPGHNVKYILKKERGASKIIRYTSYKSTQLQKNYAIRVATSFAPTPAAGKENAAAVTS